jgi:3-deoxy-manno-octulosonate cytidylyltransferase (CMP-KDO synthetase)
VNPEHRPNPMARPDVLILIPARMAATRLPGKPLAEIAGRPMIEHVIRRAEAAALGKVIVATDSEPILAAVEKAGARAVMTRADHPSGSDRIFEALQLADPGGQVDVVVNVQGDLPTLSPDDLRAAVALLKDPAVDIGTLAAEIVKDEERTNPNVVKVVGSPVAPDRLRALYFTRATAPFGEGPHYHHIGLYAYRRSALERFVALPPSALEKREKLEQLRALEAGMRIDVAVVASVPLGVDTPEDLETARRLLAN